MLKWAHHSSWWSFLEMQLHAANYMLTKGSCCLLQGWLVYRFELQTSIVNVASRRFYSTIMFQELHKMRRIHSFPMNMAILEALLMLRGQHSALAMMWVVNRWGNTFDESYVSWYDIRSVRSKWSGWKDYTISKAFKKFVEFNKQVW